VTIQWTGGDPSAWVTVSQVTQVTDAYSVQNTSQARASDGSITIPHPPNTPSVCTTLPGTPIKLVIHVTPDPSQVTAFPAPGLSLKGKHLWKYTYSFDAFISYE
jgi:hypothetical protein